MKTTMTMAIKLSSACIEVCFFVVAVAVVCLHGCISLSLFRKVALPLSIYHCIHVVVSNACPVHSLCAYRVCCLCTEMYVCQRYNS